MPKKIKTFLTQDDYFPFYEVFSEGDEDVIQSADEELLLRPENVKKLEDYFSQLKKVQRILERLYRRKYRKRF
jgi:hypothetical protein